MAHPRNSLYAFQSSAVLVRKGKERERERERGVEPNYIFLIESSVYLNRSSPVTALLNVNSKHNRTG